MFRGNERERERPASVITSFIANYACSGRHRRYQTYDGRNGISPPTAADNDLFVGTRLALNDADDTSVLSGVAIDLDTQELFLNIEAERRIGENLSVELQLRTFMNAEPGDALFAVQQDDYLLLRLSWYY